MSKGGHQTESYDRNGFYAYDDFVELARKLGLVESRYRRALRNLADRRESVFALIERSRLSDECQRLYKDHVADRDEGAAYSYSKAI